MRSAEMRSQDPFPGIVATSANNFCSSGSGARQFRIWNYKSRGRQIGRARPFGSAFFFRRRRGIVIADRR